MPLLRVVSLCVCLRVACLLLLLLYVVVVVVVRCLLLVVRWLFFVVYCGLDSTPEGSPRPVVEREPPPHPRRRITQTPRCLPQRSPSLPMRRLCEVKLRFGFRPREEEGIGPLAQPAQEEPRGRDDALVVKQPPLALPARVVAVAALGQPARMRCHPRKTVKGLTSEASRRPRPPTGLSEIRTSPCSFRALPAHLKPDDVHHQAARSRVLAADDHPSRRPHAGHVHPSRRWGSWTGRMASPMRRGAACSSAPRTTGHARSSSLNSVVYPHPHTSPALYHVDSDYQAPFPNARQFRQELPALDQVLLSKFRKMGRARHSWSYRASGMGGGAPRPPVGGGIPGASARAMASADGRWRRRLPPTSPYTAVVF